MVEVLKSLKEANLFLADDDVFFGAVNHPHFPKAIGERLLVCLPEIEGKTRGGLYLPQESAELALIKMTTGRIVSIGEGVGLGDAGIHAECKKLKVGDWINFCPHVGFPIYQHGIRLLCILDGAIMTLIQHPKYDTGIVFDTYVIKGLSHEGN